MVVEREELAAARTMLDGNSFSVPGGWTSILWANQARPFTYIQSKVQEVKLSANIMV